MATTPERIEKYKRLLSNLLPLGKLWQPDRQPTFASKLRSLAVELCRVEDRMNDLLREADPRNADELLEDWLRITGLPDECTPDGLSLDDLRDQMVQKYTNVGGLSKSFYEAVGLRLGYTIVIDNYWPFLAGQSRAGDRLTNYYDHRFRAGQSRAGDILRQHGWRFVFKVTAPLTAEVRFRAGNGRAGDPLTLFQNELVRCTIQKLKPAHTSFTLDLI